MNNGSVMPNTEFSIILGSNKNNTAPNIAIFFLKKCFTNKINWNCCRN